ncbi:MAG: FecR family protein [Rhizobiaceae bacterium]
MIKCFQNRGLFIALALIGASAFEMSTTVLAAPAVGTSAAVKGKVFVSTRGASRKAQVRDTIKLQDKIVTKDDSALQILLLDRSTFTVGQNCEMVIDKFVYDPDTTSGKISAKVAKGAFRFMSGRIGKNNPTNASVSTPSATIGIRGTFFEGIVGQDAMALAQLGGIDASSANPGQASLVILRGPGRRRNTLDRAGRIVISNSNGSVAINKPDYAVFVPSAGAAPIGPFRVTPAMREYLDFFLRSEPNGQPERPREIAEGGKKASGQDRFEIPAIVIDPLVEEVQDGITDPNGDPGNTCSTYPNC